MPQLLGTELDESLFLAQNVQCVLTLVGEHPTMRSFREPGS